MRRAPVGACWVLHGPGRCTASEPEKSASPRSLESREPGSGWEWWTWGTREGVCIWRDWLTAQWVGRSHSWIPCALCTAQNELTGKLILLIGSLDFFFLAHNLDNILTIIFLLSFPIKIKSYNVSDYPIAVYKCMHIHLWWYLEILRYTSGRTWNFHLFL